MLQFLARLFFKKSLRAYSQGTAGTGKIYYVKSSQGWQLFKRHIMIIVKEPTFLLNAVLSLIVPVIMFIVTSFSGQFSLEMLASEQLKPYLVLIFSGIIISPSIVSNISSTAITREGQAFWETKVLPISAETNIKYRILTTIVINLLGILILSLLSAYLLPVTLKMILLGIFLAVTTTFFLGTLDFIVNIYRPLLNWSHPTAAVKNNMNVTISLGIRAVIGLMFFGIYKIFSSLLSNYNLIILYTGIIFLVGYIITHYLLYNYFVKKFDRISL
jgi:ABC-2 type transport system permease protein